MPKMKIDGGNILWGVFSVFLASSLIAISPTAPIINGATDFVSLTIVLFLHFILATIAANLIVLILRWALPKVGRLLRI